MGVTRRASRARSQSPAAGVSKSPAARARAGGVDKMNGYIDRDLGVQPFLVEETFHACEPHTITGLVVFIVMLVYVGSGSGITPGTEDKWSQQRAAHVTAGLGFLVYCAFQLRDSMLMRPHPALWRIVHGAAVLYLLCMVYLYMLSPEYARELIACVPVSVNCGNISAPAENTQIYAQDCRLIGDEGFPAKIFRDTVFDIFVFSHLFGWLCMSIIVRDAKVAWAMSILFEVLEISLDGVLPNFKECWWDRFGLDLFGANALGIVLGLQLCKYFEFKEYNWTGLNDIQTRAGQLKRIAAQMTPHHWEKITWNTFNSFRNFSAATGIIFFIDLAQLLGFPLKYVLWIAPNHWFNYCRLLIWVFLAVPGTLEWYVYTVEARVGLGLSPMPAYAKKLGIGRLGPNGWIALGIIAMEFLIIFKFQGDLWTGSSFHWTVKWAWGLTSLSLAVWSYLFFAVLPTKREQERTSGAKPVLSQQLVVICDTVFFAAGVPMVLLCLYDGQKTFDDFGMSGRY